MGPSGRKENPFIAVHFTKVKTQEGKSRRYFYKCNYCYPEPVDADDESKLIIHRDHRLLQHLTSSCLAVPLEIKRNAFVELAQKGGTAAGDIPFGDNSEASTPSGTGAPDALQSEDHVVQESKRQKGLKRTLGYYADRVLQPEEKERADIRFLRFLIYSNIPFNAADSPFLVDWMKVLRPTYETPSRYVLTHKLLPAEASRVHLEEFEALKTKKMLTLMTDGWDDAMHRSLYGTIVAERGEFPTMLSLENLTGKRGSAETITEAVKTSMAKMGVEGNQLIAMVTDDPTVMSKVRRNYEQLYWWIIILACFLHKLNGIVGKIVVQYEAKKVISLNTKIVNFFGQSHYWGGQLDDAAKTFRVTRGLKINTESRWYSLILLCMSVLEHRSCFLMLEQICRRPDAMKKTNGMSAVAPEIIIAVREPSHWDRTAQVIRFCKPIVDAIGTLEARDASLADCMLELLRCAREINRTNLTVEFGDSPAFAFHAKTVFNEQFAKINTDIHFLALYLHPLCRKLAVSNAPHSRTFPDVCKIATGLALKFRWSEPTAAALFRDLQIYQACKAPFDGGLIDGALWWDSLPISTGDHPLKGLAIILFKIVPHSAEVESLFSNLGGIQSAKRSNLSVETMEMLGKLRGSYVKAVQDRAVTLGENYRRKHTHSRIRELPGIDITTVTRLEAGITEDNQVAEQARKEMAERESLHAEVYTEISLDELDAAFAAVEEENLAEARVEPVAITAEGAEGRVIVALSHYTLEELDKVDKKEAPKAVEDDLSALRSAEQGRQAWNVDALLCRAGIL